MMVVVLPPKLDPFKHQLQRQSQFVWHAVITLGKQNPLQHTVAAKTVVVADLEMESSKADINHRENSTTAMPPRMSLTPTTTLQQ